MNPIHGTNILGKPLKKQHYLQMNVSFFRDNFLLPSFFFPTYFVPSFKNSFPIPANPPKKQEQTIDPGLIHGESDQTAPTTGTNGRELAA